MLDVGLSYHRPMWTVMGSGLALVDLSVVEQSYRAVLAVSRSEQKIVVAAHTASVFWVRDGYTDVIDRMTAVIELPDTSPPSPEQRGFWGYTAFDRGRRENLQLHPGRGAYQVSGLHHR